jgi:hypothetical protein
MSSLGFGLACLGFLLLSFSLRKHYRLVWPESTDFSQWVWCNRLLGYALVFLALVPCIVAYDVWIGLVLWLSLLALAAILATLFLTYWPSRSLLFAGASIALVVAGLVA